MQTLSPLLRLAVRRTATLGSVLLAVAAMPSGAIEVDVRRDATVEATEKVIPSVVNIATTTIVERAGDPSLEFARRYFGWRVPTERREELFNIGSGVILDEEGYILTNFHVLDRASKVYAKLWDGSVREVEPMVPFTKQKDVALLKLRTKSGERFKAIKFAKDDDLLLGETVLALGNPYGLGTSVTRGILSSKVRRPASGDEPLGTRDWLQTDADINPGNSGGPLINLRGELIGINVAVYREAQGMGVGFAIPIKQITSALTEFFSPELTDSLWFGASVGGFKAPLTIADVQPGSPAEKAGLRTGQRIVRVNGELAGSLVDFNRLLTADKNYTATLQVRQDADSRNVEVKLVPFVELIRQKLGLTLLKLPNQTAASYGINPGAALFIEKVEPKSPADKAQLERGILLTGIDGQATGELLQVALALSQKKSGERVSLSVVVQRQVGPGYAELRQGKVELTVR